MKIRPAMPRRALATLQPRSSALGTESFVTCGFADARRLLRGRPDPGVLVNGRKQNE